MVATQAAQERLAQLRGLRETGLEGIDGAVGKFQQLADPLVALAAFLDLVDYAHDQGWTEGSTMGSRWPRTKIRSGLVSLWRGPAASSLAVAPWTRSLANPTTSTLSTP